MKMKIYGMSSILREDPLQLGEACLGDRGNGFEVFQQILLSLGTDSGDVIQLRITEPFAS